MFDSPVERFYKQAIQAGHHPYARALIPLSYAGSNLISVLKAHPYWTVQGGPARRTCKVGLQGMGCFVVTQSVETWEISNLRLLVSKTSLAESRRRGAKCLCCIRQMRMVIWRLFVLVRGFLVKGLQQAPHLPAPPTYAVLVGPQLTLLA